MMHRQEGVYGNQVTGTWGPVGEGDSVVGGLGSGVPMLVL